MDGEVGFTLGFGDEILAQVSLPEEPSRIQKSVPEKFSGILESGIESLNENQVSA